MEDGLKFTNVDFPMPVSQITCIERQNNLAINVFGCTSMADIYPLYVSKNNFKSNPSICWCLEMKTRVTSVGSNFFLDCSVAKSIMRNIKILLLQMFISFLFDNKFDRHKQDCRGIDAAPAKTVLPTKDSNTLKFRNYKNKHDAPFIVYADLELILRKTTDTSRPREHLLAVTLMT